MQRHHIRQPAGGLEAARERGRATLMSLVNDGILVPGGTYAAGRNVSSRKLAAAVARGELFSMAVRGRRYYVAALLEVDADAVAAVCQALGQLSDASKTIFCLRSHGALAGRNVVGAIKQGQLGRVVGLAKAWAEEYRGCAADVSGDAAAKDLLSQPGRR